VVPLNNESDLEMRSIMNTKMRTLVVFFAVLSGTHLIAQSPQLPKNDPATLAAAKAFNDKLQEIQPYLVRATEHYLAGRFPEADVECRRALVMYEALGSKAAAAETVLLQAEVNLALGRFEEVLKLLLPLTKVGLANSPRLWSNAALANLALSRIHEAQQAMERAAAEAYESIFHKDSWEEIYRLKTGTGQNFSSLALLLRVNEFILGAPGRAIPDLKRAVELSPGNAALRLALGRSYRSLRRWNEAKAELERAASSSEPSSREAKALLARGPLPP
jgi:tetratricopeptide (TPR) repeat protein